MATLQNPRELRGLGIISQGGDAIVKVSETAYSVKSQSNGGRYAVTVGRTGNWYCECPDFTGRNVNCKHIFAVLFSRKLAAQAEWDARQEAPTPPSPAPMKPDACPACGSPNVVKDGTRKTQRGEVQRFSCKACGKWFTPDKAFSRMKHDPKAITATMSLWFGGFSLRKITDHLGQFYGVRVNPTTPLRWIRKYSALLASYADQHKAEAGDFWHCDEMTVNIRGEGGRKALEWIWNLMDSKTRFLLACRITKTRFVEDAQAVIEDAQGRTDTRPMAFITDGLKAYHDAANDAFYDNAAPIRNPHLIIPPVRTQDPHLHPGNNILERLNGTTRERLKVMRGFGTKEGAKLAMDGWRAYYNLIRPHQGLQGKTPAEMAGIPLPEGDNRWMALIQAASAAMQQGVEKKSNQP